MEDKEMKRDWIKPELENLEINATACGGDPTQDVDASWVCGEYTLTTHGSELRPSGGHGEGDYTKNP